MRRQAFTMALVAVSGSFETDLYTESSASACTLDCFSASALARRASSARASLREISAISCSISTSSELSDARASGVGDSAAAPSPTATTVSPSMSTSPSMSVGSSVAPLTASPTMGLPARCWIRAVTSATVCLWSQGTMMWPPPGAETFNRTFPISSVLWNSGSAGGGRAWEELEYSSRLRVVFCTMLSSSLVNSSFRCSAEVRRDRLVAIQSSHKQGP